MSDRTRIASPSHWVCLHSLTWLTLGNAVGVLLAVLLLVPPPSVACARR